ncbi:hypothetical protein [Paraburkholderia sp. BCC1884]|uniref:hypothetical protein n=1 Tax=Paraburkholderia sp. BCC1884 TaxID=2562668 RepID=UPI00118372B1|nr:hypothetical protein [Paraburkholderia sp. BCC1884]
MKIRRAEYLVAIAIVTSAAVLQIREHMMHHGVESATMHETGTTCGAAHDGLVPAACEPTRDESADHRGVEPQHGASQIWV